MDKIWLLSIAICMVIVCDSCKPKQIAYKAAYEEAQERLDEFEEDEFADESEFADEVGVTPVTPSAAVTPAPAPAPTFPAPTAPTPRSGDDFDAPFNVVSPVSSSPFGYPDINESLNIATRQERINPYEGESPLSLGRFNVVIGSFSNRANAVSLRERMQYEGYNAALAENELGMIRVIISSFDNKAEAARFRATVKTKFYPNFQDAWVLERRY
jgi:cell division protein FtsN